MGFQQQKKRKRTVSDQKDEPGKVILDQEIHLCVSFWTLLIAQMC